MQTDFRAAGTLPHALTPLIGPEREVAAGARLLRDGQRLVTLTGPGGVGKTRLSLAVAQRIADLFPAGSVFVSLAPILDPEVVPRVVAAAFDLADPDTSDAVSTLISHVGEQRVLLVMDNFDHILEAATLVPALLAACPSLCVLATSRRPLQVADEHLLPVPTLSAPASALPEEVAQSARCSCSSRARVRRAASST
jgi:predicted ATPase